MPSMYVNIPKMDSGKKDQLAEKLYEAAAQVIRGHKIYTYVNEFDTVYENGKAAPTKMQVINMEAGPMPAEKIEVIAGHMDAAVKAVMGEDYETTLVYHANQLDHIATNGKLLKK